MNQTNILYPMSSLVLFTFSVLLFIPYRRFRAALAGYVTSEDFRYGESENVPSEVRIPNRNFMNLLEIPVLFYVACVTLYATKHVDLMFLYLGWGYVALRVCHSIIHLTYNHVLHRMILFVLSNAVLTTMWIRIILHL